MGEAKTVKYREWSEVGYSHGTSHISSVNLSADVVLLLTQYSWIISMSFHSLPCNYLLPTRLKLMKRYFLSESLCLFLAGVEFLGYLGPP